MKLNKIFIYFFLTLAVVFTSANAATVYKWVDEDGHVHYGSKPKNDDAQEIEIENSNSDSENLPAASSPLNAEERADKQKRFINAMEEENESLAEAKRKKEEQEEMKLSRCNASRDQLKRAEGAGALYDLDEKGDRVLLNKKQYEQAMEQARARVEKWCN